MYRQAEDREADVFRRDPEGGGRVSPAAARLSRGRMRRQRLANPVWHIHRGEPPASDMVVQLRDAAEPRERGERRRTRTCSGASSAAMRRRRRRRRIPGSTRRRAIAVRYFEDFVQAGEGATARPTHARRAALGDLRDRLAAWDGAGGRRGAAGHGLRGRQGARLRAAARLVRGDLRGAARRERRGRASAGSSRSTASPETIALIEEGLGGRLNR